MRRATPGQLKTVGLYTETPSAPPPNPRLPPQFQPPPPQADYRFLGSVLREEFGFESLNLEGGHVPDHVDVVLVGKLGDNTPKQQFAIDQFLMRGGKLIALAGRHQIVANREGLRAEASASPFFEMLSGYGVEVGDALVMDSQNAPFPIPIQEQVGGMRLQRIELLPYPFFVDVRRDGMDVGNPSFSGVQNLTGPWSSPLQTSPPEGVEAEILLESSSASWLNDTGNIEPDLKRFPGRGFGPAGELGASTLAVALGGTFPSYFAERPSPLFAPDAAAADALGATPDATGRTLKRSLPDARLVVVGSSELASDLILQLSQQPGGEVHRGNLQWILNLVDWLVAEPDLLRIRSTGAFARTLRPLAEGEARRFEFATYFAVLLALGLVTFTAQRLLARPSRLLGAAGEGGR